MSAEAHEHNRFEVGAHHADYNGDKFGMWLFLFTELILFGGMFLAFFVYSTTYYGAEFHEAGTHLNRFMGGGNTIILLTSSLTMVFAITAIQYGRKYLSMFWICLTILCAMGFMVVKYFEWGYKFHHHIFPAKAAFLEAAFGQSDLKKAYNKEFMDSGLTLAEFNEILVNASGEPAPDGMTADEAHIAAHVESGDKKLAQSEKYCAHAETCNKSYVHKRYTQGQIIFYGLYFAMTGLHGIHVLGGVIVLLWVLWLLHHNKIVANDFIVMENVGLYWHVVDLIWIYLFPVFYLVS